MQYNQGNSKLTKSLDEIIGDKSTLPIEIHNTSIQHRITYQKENSTQTSNASNGGWNSKKNCGKQNVVKDLNTQLTNRNFNRSGEFGVSGKKSNKSALTDLRHFISKNRQYNRSNYKINSRLNGFRNFHPLSINNRRRNFLSNNQINRLNQRNIASVALSEAAVLLHESFNGLNHLAKIILDSNEKLRASVDNNNNYRNSTRIYEPSVNYQCRNNESLPHRNDNLFNDCYSFYSQHPYYVNKSKLTDNDVLSSQNQIKDDVSSVSIAMNSNVVNPPMQNHQPVQQSSTINANDVFINKPQGCTQNGFGILVEHNSACQTSDLLSPIGAITHIEKLDRSTMLVYFEKEQDAHYAVCQYNQKYLDGFPLSLTLIKK